MATTVTLTPKQKQVKELLEQGKTPAEVAKKLKVNVNSVYQHIRRMKAAEGAPAKPARKSTAKRTTRKAGTRRASTRKSTGRKAPTRRTAPRPAPAPVPVAEQRTMTPLQAIRHRKSELESGLSESARTVAQAEKALKEAQEAHAKLEASREGELKQLTAAEAALSGKKVPAKRSRSGGSKNGSGSKAAAQSAAPATPPPAATDGRPSEGTAPAPAPEPAAEPVSAEPPAEMMHEPAEPVAVGAGVEEERPGVETVPEFQGEDDPFA